MVKIGNKTLLGYQLDNLAKCNISDIIITTGPFENKIRKYVEKKYPDINISYVNNQKYNTTNYIYSMWLTKKLIDDNIILLHGDLLFERKLLKRLINKKYSNCVLVNKKVKPPKKDFKAIVKNNKVVKIGVGFLEDSVLYSAPLYKFSKSDFLYWLDKIEEFIKKGDTKSYAEDAFNKISDKIVLRPLYFDDELCMEIDTEDDLEMARNIIHEVK